MQNTLRQEATDRLLRQVLKDRFGPDTPVGVDAKFTPGTGWRQATGSVTYANLATLRTAGVTAVALTDGSSTVDFQVAELLAPATLRR